MKYTTFVFVDAHLEDLETLSMHLPHTTKIAFLNSDENLLSQIADTLEGTSGAEALHIITHGRSGEILLGKNGVSLETLPLYGKELLIISDAMSESGELFLYGCEVASGERGAAFVSMLQDITGLKIAAATHKVGHNELGGSWELDFAPMVMSGSLEAREWRGVLAAPVDGTYTFANAVDNSDGTYTTEDGFFLISAVNGEVADVTDDLVYADGDGASLSVSGPTSSPASPTSYLEVKPTTTGSFTLNSAVIGETYTIITADNDYTNIYVVGYANGVEMARTATYSSIDALEPTYTFSQDYFSPFANKMIDTVRVYFDTPAGDMADRLTLINMNISGASTTPAPEVPVVRFSYNASGTNFSNGWAQENSLGNTVAVDHANIYFGGGVNDGIYTKVSEIGGSSGVTGFDGQVEYFALTAFDDNTTFFLHQFKVYNDSQSDITLTITGHASFGVFDSWLAANPAQKTTTATAKAGAWTTVDLPGDFGEYPGYRLDSGADTERVPLYFNDFALDVTPPPPPPPPPPVAFDLNGTEDGNDFSVTLAGTPVALADSDADTSGVTMIFLYLDLSQIKAGDKLIFGDLANGGVEIALDTITGTAGNITPVTFGTSTIEAYNDRNYDQYFGTEEYIYISVIGQGAEGTAQLLKTDMKFSGSVAGDRVFYFLDDQFQPAATATVAVEGGSLVPDTITPYISGKEQMVINEDADGALAINGFTLGNAGDADDTTTELTISIAAAHGTLTLGTTTGVSFTNATNNGAETIEFKGTIADLHTAINSLSYDPEDTNVANDPLTIQISADDGASWQPYTVDVPGKFYYAPNGHYYEFVSDSGITWDEAKTAAEARELYGLNGYLVTVTSDAENDFIAPKLGGDGWMGASDATTEGTWKWVTGPESGTHFYNGYADAGTDSYSVNGPDVYDSEGDYLSANGGTTVNVAVDGHYENWANGEPNNSDGNVGEDVAHFYESDGSWNDYSSTNSSIQGYIVEYGGDGNDAFGTLTAAKLTIIVNQKPTLTNMVTAITFTEADAQVTPQLIDNDVTFSEDDVTMNRTYDEWGSSTDGMLNINFVDESNSEIYLYNEFLSFKTQGDITIDTSNEEIFYQETYIGNYSTGSYGVNVNFNTTNPVPAAAVDALIQSLTYETNDAPMSTTRLKIVATDNTGLAGDPVYVDVTVTTENDAPTITSSGGVMTTDIDPETWDEAYSILQLSGEKFVVVGTSGDDSYLTLIYHNADGSLNTALGEDGKIVTSIPISSFRDATLDDGGNIYFTGKSDENHGYPKFFVAKFDNTGALDTDFGTDGIAISSMTQDGNSRAIIVQNNGQIVTLANNYDDSNFAVERFNADGTTDTTFGTGGIAFTNIGDEAYAKDIAMQADGKIVVVGYTYDSSDGYDKVAIARYNTDGTLDTTFNTTGMIVEDNSGAWSGYGNYLYANKVVVQSDGKILVGGTADGDGLLLVRYNDNGSLDNTFGTGGKVTIDDNQYNIDDINDMVVDGSGNIFVLGGDDYVVAKFTSTGVLDGTFGTDGTAEINISGYGEASSLFIATDGKLLIAGSFEDSENYDGKFLVARLNADGTPDMDFGSKATFEKDGDAVLLDSGISVNDPDLAEYDGDLGGDFNGFTLTIAREDGANANDVFSAIDGGDLTLADGNIVIYDDENIYNNVTVGTYTQVGGTLTLIFNSDAYKDYDYSLVNQVARNIAYSNTDSSLTEDTTVNLVWTFSDTVTSDTFVQTVNITIPAPQITSSVTLNVANPFTPEEDTTAITIAAPEGINISGAVNSAITGLPKNVKMPLGQFAFTLEGVAVGGTVEMSMTADADFKQFSYFKQNLVTGKWVNIMEGVTINDNGTPNDASDDIATVKFSLTDGGVYDADRIANGVIVDPGGVGENALLPMIAENTTEVGTISLLDNTMASGTLSYEITGGADAAKFTVNASTGLLSFAEPADYETPTDLGDTAANNTYAVQVTVTGSTSGSEVQNLIITVLNVAENGDNPNTAPVIVGLRAEAQAVTVGTAAALDDIRVADVDENTITVTLSATNGTIGGLEDADEEIDGIQLIGTAADINEALASATFTAAAAGNAGVSLSVVDTNVNSGTPITTTAFYSMSATAASSSGGTPPPPTTTTTTVDGTEVEEHEVTETRTTTDEDGHTTTRTVNTEQVVIAPITSDRTEDTGSTTTADVPLFWGESSRTEWATTASIPVGIGLTSEGSRAPTQTQTAQTVLDDLIYYIDTTTPETDGGKTGMLNGGTTFLEALSNIETLVVNKITLSTTNTEASQVPITITGTANTVVTTDGTIAPVEALVIDAQSLQAGSMLNLQNVEFAVVIGENLTIRGGEGKNILFTGAGSQNIMLGADDDQLYAGDGDDTVGSAGGDDSIFGEAGNDTVFGGEGNDQLHGGSGTDIVTYTLNMSDYTITRDEGKTYVALVSNPTEIDTLINAETIQFADSNYTVENSVSLTQIATVYTMILDRQAEVGGFQHWAHHSSTTDISLGSMAINFMQSQEYKINNSTDWNTLSTEDKVEELYVAFFDRASEAGGKQNWLNYIASGATFEQVAEEFVHSVELSGLYQNKEDWNFFV